jgi:hypothetical protein
MSTSRKARRWTAVLVPLAAVAIAVSSLSSAQATSSHQAMNMGQNQFGKTDGNYKGLTTSFTYTKGYFCDTSVSAASSTGCEVGAKWVKAPSRQHDPLYITVPLGFTVPAMKMECPAGLVCVDHPATLDLSRLATALAPIFGTTPAKLAPSLKNFATPGHDHYISDLNNRKAEWWDVYVVGVTDKATFDKIEDHNSYGYIQNLINHKNPNVTAPIPTNLFLYFAVK